MQTMQKKLEDMPDAPDEFEEEVKANKELL